MAGTKRQRSESLQQQLRIFVVLGKILTFSFLLLQAALAVSKRPEIYVSTLDGTLYCLYQDTGEVKWKLEDGTLAFLREFVQLRTVI